MKHSLLVRSLAIVAAAAGLAACHSKSTSSSTPATAAAATVPPLAQQTLPNPLPSLTVTSATFTAGGTLPNSMIYNSFGWHGRGPVAAIDLDGRSDRNDQLCRHGVRS